jgi:hypothetical protein
MNPRSLLLVSALLAAGLPSWTQAPAAASHLLLLSPEEAKAAIVDDGKAPYFDRLTPVEIAVKTAGSKGDAAEARRRYQASVKAFAPEELAAFAALVEWMQPKLATTYPLLDRTPFSLLKVSAKIEGGLPHTRDRHILFADDLLKQAAALHQTNPLGFRKAMGPLLLHEQMHVIERLFPERFEKLFTEVWGFRHLEKALEHSWLAERQLLNPDGPDIRWIYPVKDGAGKRWIWPLVILREPKASMKMPQDFLLVGVALEEADGAFKVAEDPKTHVPKLENLGDMEDLLRRFPNPGELYHPNEIAADWIAEVIWEDLTGATVDASDPEQAVAHRRVEKIRAWARENLR